MAERVESSGTPLGFPDAAFDAPSMLQASGRRDDFLWKSKEFTHERKNMYTICIELGNLEFRSLDIFEEKSRPWGK